MELITFETGTEMKKRIFKMDQKWSSKKRISRFRDNALRGSAYRVSDGEKGITGRTRTEENYYHPIPLRPLQPFCYYMAERVSPRGLAGLTHSRLSTSPGHSNRYMHTYTYTSIYIVIYPYIPIYMYIYIFTYSDIYRE